MKLPQLFRSLIFGVAELKNPGFGPASSIQLLDEPGVPENGDLQC